LVRRGTGADADVLLADMLITDAEGIQLIRSGKRAVSFGYDAHYRQIADGMGAQHNIRCNHVALVDEGRCGALHDRRFRTGDLLTRLPWRRVECGARDVEATPLSTRL
jgi:hypothetical protein